MNAYYLRINEKDYKENVEAHEEIVRELRKGKGNLQINAKDHGENAGNHRINTKDHRINTKDHRINAGTT